MNNSFGLDDEREPGNTLENGVASDNEEDEVMEDADADADGDPDEEEEDEGDKDDEDEDVEEPDEEQDEADADQEDDSQPAAARSRSATQPPSRPAPLLRPGADLAVTYDIVPYIAAPQSTSINAICATPCMRWVFTGGTDGYIRRYDWFGSINGKVPLTVAQKHPFVDSVTRAGILLSYWENEEPVVKNSFLHVPETTDDLKLSPVYSLAVQNQSLWLLSGLESGGINLQSVRHDEGKIVTTLRKHSSAVSVLTLSSDERSVLSGSWDKNIYDWDLNTGQVAREYTGSAGQISAIQFRTANPTVPWDQIRSEPLVNGVSSSRSDQVNGTITATTIATTNGTAPAPVDSTEPDAPGSPAESTRSFGSLFGDDDDIVLPGDGDEMSAAIANGQPAGAETQPEQTTLPEPAPALEPPQSAPPPTMNGQQATLRSPSPPTSAPTPDDTIFLASSMDGTLRLWDRRTPVPAAISHPPRGTPPWCMSATFSSTGNEIYAGRRNGTVEEFSLRQGISNPIRTLKFPAGSGAVSAVTAMPNGRHLVCGSYDNLRLFDLKFQEKRNGPTVPFLIIPGHHGGVVGGLYVDRTCHYLISTAGNRGWEGANTEVWLGYEITW